MSEVNRLVASIIQFLNEQREGSQLSSDAKESLEVAVQCLESAFGVSQQDTAALGCGKPLEQVFADGLKVESALPPEPTEADRAEAERLKEEGNACVRSDKYLEAYDFYTRAIQLDGRNAVYYCNRAACLNHLGTRPMEAIEDCKMALKIDPSYSKAYGRMGLAYANMGKFQEARECYQKALTMEPSNESYRNSLTAAEANLTAATNNPGIGGLAGLSGLAGLAGLGRGAAGASAGGGMPGMDLNKLLANPSFMNMASQLLTDPNMQQVPLLDRMSNIMTGNVNQGGSSMEALLQAGQHLAQQMQSANPQLVEQLRQQMGQGGAGSANGAGQNHQGEDPNKSTEGSGDAPK